MQRGGAPRLRGVGHDGRAHAAREGVDDGDRGGQHRAQPPLAAVRRPVEAADDQRVAAAPPPGRQRLARAGRTSSLLLSRVRLQPPRCKWVPPQRQSHSAHWPWHSLENQHSAEMYWLGTGHRPLHNQIQTGGAVQVKLVSVLGRHAAHVCDKMYQAMLACRRSRNGARGFRAAPPDLLEEPEQDGLASTAALVSRLTPHTCALVHAQEQAPHECTPSA